jgi:hypothetical protein
MPERIIEEKALAMTKPTKVVFDIGNVLLRWDPRNLYRRIFDDEKQMEWFLAHVCTPDWNVEQDRGRDWDEAVALLVKDHPKHETQIRAFHERWDETVSGVFEDHVAELLHHEFLRPQIRSGAGALPVPVGLRRHHRLRRRAPAEARSGHLPSPARPLWAQGRRLRVHRRFQG